MFTVAWAASDVAMIAAAKIRRNTHLTDSIIDFQLNLRQEQSSVYASNEAITAENY